MKVLIVEDEKRILDSLTEVLNLEGYTVSATNSIRQAKKNLWHEPYDIVLLDLWLPDGDGMSLLADLKELEGPPAVLVMTGHGSIDKAVNAVKLGAFDFLEKPLNLDRLLVTVRNCAALRRSLIENQAIRRQEPATAVIGESAPIRKLIEMVDTVAPTAGRVLITGENGSGKELVARRLHDKSPRAGESFIKVNCAAIPGELIESELFGYEPGAFTGATALKYGKFELAHRGTIFLDEIGELPLSLQAKMLRVLQEKQFERIGGSKTYTVDVRIVAATNVSLEEAVAQGRFRADLYYRLNVVPIVLPPLRRRKEDIPLLVGHFLAVCNERNSKKVQISPELLDFFIDYPWPGNIREMQNLLERMVILAEGDRLSLDDLPPGLFLVSDPVAETVREPAVSPADTNRDRRSLKDLERREIEAALRRNGWVQVRAARDLGLTERQMGYRIKKFGLNRYDSFRE